MEKIRLQKYLSECGVLSRRAAEAEILSGSITVNGVTANLGDKIDPDCDTVVFRGKEVRRNADSRRTYIILNKPSGYVTTMSDEQGRNTVADLIKNVGTRVYPVGRLDLYSDGLLLCTDDGELTNRITHPSHSVPKVYRAYITTHLTDADLTALAVPFELDGYMLRPFDVKFIEHRKIGEADGTIVEITLYEGRNREIRNICAHHGLKLSRLTRISIGSITLDGLAPGKWRHLTEDEVEFLKKI